MAVTDAVEAEFQGKDLEQLKRMFQRSEEAHKDARALSRRDVDWYDNYDNSQWSQEEKETLRKRGQPIVVSNRIKRKVGFLIGFEQRSRSDPKAYPRNPQDEQAAGIATDVLDYIDQESGFDREASAAFKDLCLSGIEVAEAVWDEEEGDIRADRIDSSKFFYDPRSREANFSDARYLGYSDWHDLEEAEELFPDAAEQIRESIDLAVEDEDYEDKPYGQWGDSERQRVRIAVVYYRMRGAWAYAYFTGGGIIEQGQSPYLSERGKPCCPIIAQSAFVTRDNERYGVVRDMIGPQMETNYRRSMSLFLLKSQRMWQQSKEIFPNPARAKEEAASANGLLTANGVYGQQWGFIDSSAEIAGNFELLQEAKGELDVQGPNAGLQGRGTEGQSGRAIIAQQNAGITEENHLFDAHNDWKLRVYRSMWARAKQFWRDEKWLRVTDDENAFRFAHVNVPIVGFDEFGNKVIVGMENALAEMDVDIIIEAGPDTITLQHEQFEQLTQLAQSGYPIPPDILISASQLRDKQKLLERMSQPDPSAQQSAQLEMAEKQAGIEKTQADAAKSAAQALNEQIEARQKIAPPVAIY